MDNDDHPLRFLPLDAPDLRIRAQVRDETGAYRRIVFRSGEIAYLAEADGDVSVIRLKSGVAIPVGLSIEKLERAVYMPDFRSGSVLDFTAQTGPAAEGAKEPRLAEEFNKKSGILIKAILRRGSSNSAVGFDFFESDVAAFVNETGTRSKTGSSVKVIFNAGAKTPFGKDANHHLDMPYEDFMQALVRAKNSGLKQLDLCALFVEKPSRYGFNPL